MSNLLDRTLKVSKNSKQNEQQVWFLFGLFLTSRLFLMLCETSDITKPDAKSALVIPLKRKIREITNWIRNEMNRPDSVNVF